MQISHFEPEEFLKTFQKLQYSIMSDEMIDMEFASLTFSHYDPSPSWNNALITSPLDSNQLDLLEAKFTENNKPAVLYFPRNIINNRFIDILIKRGYHKEFEDVWMFYSNNKPIPHIQIEARTVRTEYDLSEFLKTFVACYVNGDPQNPYGAAGDTLIAAKKSWLKHQGTGRLEYYMIMSGSIPVAISVLTNFNGIGYISDIGSRQEVRGKGFGKAATYYALQKSIEQGNNYHCLATESGSFPNEFYKRLGFTTKFNAMAYKKPL